MNILGEFGVLDWDGVFVMVEWKREDERQKATLSGYVPELVELPFPYSSSLALLSRSSSSSRLT